MADCGQPPRLPQPSARRPARLHARRSGGVTCPAFRFLNKDINIKYLFFYYSHYPFEAVLVILAKCPFSFARIAS